MIIFTLAGYKTPHTVWSESLSSYPAGFSNIIKIYPHYDDINLLIIISIENSKKKPFINAREIRNFLLSSDEEQYLLDNDMALGLTL